LIYVHSLQRRRQKWWLHSVECFELAKSGYFFRGIQTRPYKIYYRKHKRTVFSKFYLNNLVESSSQALYILSYKIIRDYFSILYRESDSVLYGDLTIGK